MELKGTGTRLLATVVDGVIIWGLMMILGKYVPGTLPEGFTVAGAFIPMWLIVGLAYFVVFEGLKGATVGKMILGLKVVKEDGEACDLLSALVRNLVRPIDVVTFFIWATNRQQRLGDFMAKTVVVEETH